jgi:glycine/D-amino acid oxidase-like deaminating enzyme
MPHQPKVVVVGAGIVGASIAWHLVHQGAEVTVVEAGEPGGIATRNSWAWINASWGNPQPYFRLRVRAMEEWHRLARELPGLPIAWPGSLNWQLDAAGLEAFARQHAAWGYDIRCVDKGEAQRIEPHLGEGPALAVHARQEGVVEALPAARVLLSAAQEKGAVVVSGEAVRAIDLRADRVLGVRTEYRHLAADGVVIAAGAASPMIAATAGLALPVADPQALLVTTRPHARVLNGMVMTPMMELRQMPDGRLSAAAGLDESDLADDGAAAAARVFEAVKRLLAGMDQLAFERHVVARRPMPADRLPIVGRMAGVDGLHVAVTHSGVTLAAALGRFVAAEVMTGERAPLLAPFGLERLGPR